MEPTQPNNQHAICSTCSHPIERRRLARTAWGAWLHVTVQALNSAGHEALPRRHEEPYPQVDPFDPTDIGDWSRHGKIGPATPASSDPRCEDCGREIDYGYQCPGCRERDETSREMGQ
jgi:hypothetical protein